MSLAFQAFLLAGFLAGGVLWWVGFRVARLSDRPGRRAFVAFSLLLGTGCLVTGGLGLLPSVTSASPGDSPWRHWTDVALLLWLAATYPWFVFTLQYTGIRTDLSLRTLILVGLPNGLLSLQFLVMAVGVTAFENTLSSAVGSVFFIYIVSIAFGGSYLILQKTYTYDHLSVAQGIGLVGATAGSLAVWNLIGTASESADLTQAGAFAAGAVLAALGLWVPLARYDLFASTPAIGTLGERALTREADDLMFVVDADDALVELNETATERLATNRSDAIERTTREVLGHDVETLRNAESVPIQTTSGTRRYDPQVSAVTDHRGGTLGATVSLRDVTERELREQRLAVLNRVLRHNLRNEADVIKAHAEAVDAADSTHVDAILESADAVASLGQEANRVDQYVSGGDDVPVDIAEQITAALETVGAAETGTSISVDAPASATVVTNREAVAGALESVLDNAVTYADGAVTITVDEQPDGYAIRVADDGPGIPHWELESLDTGTESPLEHSTGLGLWQLKWAVRTLNGELSFDTDDGTTVEMTVPDRRDTHG